MMRDKTVDKTFCHIGPFNMYSKRIAHRHTEEWSCKQIVTIEQKYSTTCINSHKKNTRRKAVLLNKFDENDTAKNHFMQHETCLIFFNSIFNWNVLFIIIML